MLIASAVITVNKLSTLYHCPLSIGALPIYSCYHENELYFSISEINCTGNEEHLLNCSYNQTIPDDCAWNDDAGVMCQGMLNYSELI